MSDHYCCSRCHLRYDDCRCSSTEPSKLPELAKKPAKPLKYPPGISNGLLRKKPVNNSVMLTGVIDDKMLKKAIMAALKVLDEDVAIRLAPKTTTLSKSESKALWERALDAAKKKL